MIKPDSEILVEGGYHLHAALLREAARAAGCTVVQHTQELYTIITQFNQRVDFWNTVPDCASIVQKRIARDKWLTRERLCAAEVRLAHLFPRGRRIQRHGSMSQTMLAFRHDILNGNFAGQFVLKPLDGSGGADVHVFRHVAGFSEFSPHWKKHNVWLAEEFVVGRHYRLLILDKRVVAVAERIPPTVVGDGARDIFELVDEYNECRIGNPYFEGKGVSIETVRRWLDTDPDADSDIPAEGQIVQLHELTNVAQGATTVGVPVDAIHMEWHNIACAVAWEFDNLPVLGLDIVTTNIFTEPTPGTDAWLLEVNAVPDIAMHAYPGRGVATNVAREILREAVLRINLTR